MKTADRKKVLDYLHAHPGTMAPIIYAYFGLSKSTGKNWLADMCDAKEIRRVPAIYEYIGVKGKPANVATFAYTALVRDPIDTKPKPEPVVSNDPPWLTRSRAIRDPYKDAPYPYQGGQGAARPRCVSSMEYV